MAGFFSKLMSRRFRSERRAAMWFAGGFVVAMFAGQVLDERHCSFDGAHDKPFLNWLGRLCSDIRVSSDDLSTNGASVTVPRKGALQNMFEIPD